MGETRDPKLGNWVVFEGEENCTQMTYREASRGSLSINEPITWPITFRVHRINGDRTMEAVDIIVDEELDAKIEYGIYDMRKNKKIPDR